MSPFQITERAVVGEAWAMNEHPEIVLLIDREARRSWAAKNRDKIAAAQRESKRRYPERHRARMRVHYALGAGRLTRPDACERCGRECRPSAHHADYSKPLEVEWLCRPCHYAHHSNGGS